MKTNKISTPIVDFVLKYADEESLRLHMPGHKGKNVLGFEKLDITEIPGADSLFEADGIIAESEKNLTELFETKASFYSAFGSSSCIKAMLFLAMKCHLGEDKKKVIAAGNVHKSYVHAEAILDFETVWIGKRENLYSCKITPDTLEKAISDNPGASAVYLTSPDYLGNMQDILTLSKVCRKNGIPLLVDNAHGAYLKFTTPSMHPMDLGADMCCDSAHKTLPVVTGGAYLHVSKSCKYDFAPFVKSAMALFSSTSPSYLILASLDKANELLQDGFSASVNRLCSKVSSLRKRLLDAGYNTVGDEPLKITLFSKKYGYHGQEIAKTLTDNGIVPECFDRDCVVLMFSPFNSEGDVERVERILLSVPKKEEIFEDIPSLPSRATFMSSRQAMLSLSERVATRVALGRILASPSVSCPPAIPIALCGDKISREAIKCFEYYGIEYLDVVLDG